MQRLAIACEAPDRAMAERIAQVADASMFLVKLLERPRYPTADAMLLFLYGLSGQFDAALVLIGEGSNARSWILPEIGHQLGKGSLLNVAPVLLGDAQLPKRWPVGAPVFRPETLDVRTVLAFITTRGRSDQ